MTVKANRRLPFELIRTKRPSRSSELMLVRPIEEPADPVRQEAVAVFDRLFGKRA